MDWTKKYKEITSGFYKCAEDISDQYPDCNDFEKCIIALRINNWTYGTIQKKLGMPPKKVISMVLNKWAPELIDNSKKKDIKITNWTSEAYSILKHYDKWIEVSIEDIPFRFWIDDLNRVVYMEEEGEIQLFNDLNEIMQQQFLIAIKEQING